MTRFERTTVMWCDGSRREPGGGRRRDAGGGPAGDRSGPAGRSRALRRPAPRPQRGPAAATSPLVAAALDVPAVEERAVALASAADATVPLEVVARRTPRRRGCSTLRSARPGRDERSRGASVRRGCGRGPPGGGAGVTFDCPVLVVDGQEVPVPETVLAHEPAVVAGLDMVKGSELGAADRCGRGRLPQCRAHPRARARPRHHARTGRAGRRVASVSGVPARSAPAARCAQPSGRQPGGPGRRPAQPGRAAGPARRRRRRRPARSTGPGHRWTWPGGR